MLDNRITVYKISVAHEFSLSSRAKLEYPDGRGQYGIVFCIRGGAVFKFYNGKRCTLAPGEMIFLSSSSAYSIDFEDEFLHYTVNFTGECDEEFFMTGGYRHFRSSEIQNARYSLSSIVSERERGRGAYELRCMSYLYELLSYIFTFDSISRTASAHSLRLERAREYIDSHLTESFPVEKLAEISDMSVTSFRREWLRAYGETSVQYRDRRRLESAVSYLMSGYYNVNEVASLLGFDDVSYFVRFFRKHKGITPHKYMMNV